jgi:hypothetical protein
MAKVALDTYQTAIAAATGRESCQISMIVQPDQDAGASLAPLSLYRPQAPAGPGASAVRINVPLDFPPASTVYFPPALTFLP